MRPNNTFQQRPRCELTWRVSSTGSVCVRRRPEPWQGRLSNKLEIGRSALFCIAMKEFEVLNHTGDKLIQK